MEKYDNGTTVPNLATQVVDMLPTPTKFDYNTPRSQEAWDNAKEKHGDALQNPLKQMAAFGMLPTPVATDVEGGAVSNVQNDGKGWYRKNAKGERWGLKLRDVVESGLLPTPTTDERTKYAQGGTNLRATCKCYRRHALKNTTDNRQGEPRQPNQKMPFANWEDFPTVPPICGGNDGLPKELDGITFSKWRRESIKAYGNAIVPQVAVQIFKAIQECETLYCKA